MKAKDEPPGNGFARIRFLASGFWKWSAFPPEYAQQIFDHVNEQDKRIAELEAELSEILNPHPTSDIPHQSEEE